jgi:hypothetical protein
LIDASSADPVTLDGACHCGGSRHPADNAEHKTYLASLLRFEPADG